MFSRKQPRAVTGRVIAQDRPGALPVPHDRRHAAVTKPEVFDRWSVDAAAARPVKALAIDDGVITMFEPIGADYWTAAAITAKSVAAALRAIGDRPVEIQINSPGGDMFEGIAIYNVLREHPQPIAVKVMGMAASAASIIAMAGDTIEVGAASFIMIHNCWVVAIGNRHDMAETAKWLEPFDQAMIDLYAQRTGSDARQIADWMNAETYMSGSMALEHGFASALLGADQVVSDADAGTKAREVNDLRAMELTLVASGKSRAEARAIINKIKGTPGAALNEGTPGAADPELAVALAQLLNTIKS